MNGVTRNVVPHAMEETKMSKNVMKTTEQDLNVLRDMVIMRGNDVSCIEKHTHCVITLGMIVDLFLYFLKDIMLFSRLFVKDESELGYDMRSLYRCSLKVYNKIERRFTTQLAMLFINYRFALLDENLIVRTLYSCIDDVIGNYDFGKNEILYDALRDFRQPKFCANIVYGKYTFIFDIYRKIFDVYAPTQTAHFDVKTFLNNVYDISFVSHWSCHSKRSSLPKNEQ